MNLSLYSIQAFIILDTEGNRVLAKYYRPKSHPQGESKEWPTLKDQKAFEKGLWAKTKKAGGAYPSIHPFPRYLTDTLLIWFWGCRRHNFIRLPLGSVQTLPRPHPLLHRGTNRERLDDFIGTDVPHRRAHHASPEFVGEERCAGELGLGTVVFGRDDR